MKRFSWYTNPVKVTDYLTVYQYAVDREILIEKRKDGSRSFILVKKGAYVTSHDGGWLRFKPNRKGGHHHRRNYCICNVCGHWFRRNKGIHDECSDGPLHFCSGGCARQAEYEASLEADVGGGFVPHYWDDDEDAEWRRKNGRKEKV